MRRMPGCSNNNLREKPFRHFYISNKALTASKLCDEITTRQSKMSALLDIALESNLIKKDKCYFDFTAVLHTLAEESEELTNVLKKKL